MIWKLICVLTRGKVDVVRFEFGVSSVSGPSFSYPPSPPPCSCGVALCNRHNESDHSHTAAGETHERSVGYHRLGSGARAGRATFFFSCADPSTGHEVVCVKCSQATNLLLSLRSQQRSTRAAPPRRSGDARAFAWSSGGLLQAAKHGRCFKQQQKSVTAARSTCECRGR